MRSYLKNIPTEFHPDPIWNNWALGFLKRVAHSPNKKNNSKTSSDKQPVPDPKTLTYYKSIPPATLSEGTHTGSLFRNSFKTEQYCLIGVLLLISVGLCSNVSDKNRHWHATVLEYTVYYYLSRWLSAMTDAM